MSVRRVLPALVGIALALSTFVVSFETVTAQSSGRPSIRMLTPTRGQSFRPGEKVMITWEFVWPAGTREDPNAWCEQEIFLSLDGGQTVARRITLRLNPDVRSFEWTVPNTPTDRAVLDLHYGCETADSLGEVRNVQRKSQFRILRATKQIDEIRLAPPAKQVAPGEAIQIRWESTVRNAATYKVFVSYDRGGEFVEIGETPGTSLEWAAPADYRGSLVFRIVTETTDGKVVATDHDVRNVVTVR
jgi:hypothetical protein